MLNLWYPLGMVAAIALGVYFMRVCSEEISSPSNSFMCQALVACLAFGVTCYIGLAWVNAIAENYLAEAEVKMKQIEEKYDNPSVEELEKYKENLDKQIEIAKLKEKKAELEKKIAEPTVEDLQKQIEELEKQLETSKE